jgi:F0F1-type ATP synthase delta subunit
MSDSLGLAEVAKKYARAFINLFLDQIDREQIYNLEKFIPFIQHNKNILFYLELSFIEEKTKEELMQQLVDKFHLALPFKKLFNTLIIDKRITLLVPILRSITQLYDAAKGIITFSVVAAHELSSNELKVIEHFLVSQTHKTVVLKKALDKRLIVGIKLLSNTLGWEHSVRKQLRAIERLA